MFAFFQQLYKIHVYLFKFHKSVQKKEAHIQEKKTKKSKPEMHKENEELIEYDEKKDQNKHIETYGNESPRTAALRAMGVFANTIVDDIQKENEYNPPAEGLTSIAEENELELSLSPKRVPEITISTVSSIFLSLGFKIVL